MAKLDELGVKGKNLPPRETRTVTASNFTIGGIIGRFERSFKKAFQVNDITDKETIFGLNINSSQYGSDTVKAFFAELAGTPGSCYIFSHVGYDGTTYDGVTATINVVDADPVDTLQIDDAYQEELAFGASGNRTAYTVENGNRFETLATVAAPETSTSIQVASVIDIQVGDIIRINLTGVAPVTVYKKVTARIEASGTIEFSGALHATSTLEIDDTVEVLGFRLQLYRRDINGIVEPVDTDLGKIWCTMEPEVVDNYVQNVFSSSNWVKVTDLASASVLEASFPADVTTPTYLASGADGTTPTTSAHFAPDLLAFDNLPVRFLCNAEATTEDVNKAGEVYSKSRENDNPIWIYNLPENRTKAQLITIGQSYQRSDDVVGLIAANWLEVSDDFANSEIAPRRHVPSVGFTMGNWIRSINNDGIHFVSARRQIPFLSPLGVVGEFFLTDTDRTDIANAGVNLIQQITGRGIFLRNAFTPSTKTIFQFANGILMRNFFKVAFEDSLNDTENEPNTLDRIEASADAIRNFYYTIFTVGSTGNVAEGESFGRGKNAAGEPEQFQDLVAVQADVLNNPQSAINVGERKIDSWFSYPVPAGRIRLGVGFILR